MSSIEVSPVSIASKSLQARVGLNIRADDREHPLSNALQGWLAMTAIVLVAVDLRPAIVSIGPVLPSIRQEFHLSHAIASLLTSIPNLFMGSLALPTPWLARRFGRDRVMLGSLILLCISTVARAFSPNTMVLLCATAGVGAGIAVSGTLIAGFIKGNFPTKASLLMGVYAASLSVGSTISAATTGLLASHSDRGWRFATGAWSLFGLVAIIIWVVVTIREHQHRMKTGHSTQQHHVSLPLRKKTAWMIAAYFSFNNFLFYAMLAWLAPMFIESGSSATRAGLILGTFTVAFTFGNIVFGVLSKSHDRRRWLAICAFLTSAGIAPLAMLPNLAPFLWISVSAFGLGGGFTLGMTLPLDNTYGVAEANAWNAFVMTVGYLFAAGGPLMVGAMRDMTGGFKLPVWLLVLIAAVTLIITPLLKPHREAINNPAG